MMQVDLVLMCFNTLSWKLIKTLDCFFFPVFPLLVFLKFPFSEPFDWSETGISDWKQEIRKLGRNP